MFWEFGEHAKTMLDAIGLTEDRMNRWCLCEARRKWLNEVGEAVWAFCNPLRYSRIRSKFSQLVQTSLDRYPLSESSIHFIIAQNGLRLSKHTVGRWLSEMVASNWLSEMTIDGQRWLSLR